MKTAFQSLANALAFAPNAASRRAFLTLCTGVLRSNDRKAAQALGSDARRISVCAPQIAAFQISGFGIPKK
jgi:hypothetical protein